jgi:hypothetical protein
MNNQKIDTEKLRALCYWRQARCEDDATVLAALNEIVKTPSGHHAVPDAYMAAKAQLYIGGRGH